MNLLRVYVNYPGENSPHGMAAALRAVCTRRTPTRLHLLLPSAQNFRFALWGETSFRMRLALLRKRLEPGERIACGDVERSKRQALAQRAADVRSRNRIIFPSPHRHVRPGLDFLLSQKFFVYPGELRIRLQGALNSIEHPADAEG